MTTLSFYCSQQVFYCEVNRTVMMWARQVAAKRQGVFFFFSSTVIFGSDNLKMTLKLVKPISTSRPARWKWYDRLTENHKTEIELMTVTVQTVRASRGQSSQCTQNTKTGNYLFPRTYCARINQLFSFFFFFLFFLKVSLLETQVTDYTVCARKRELYSGNQPCSLMFDEL